MPDGRAARGASARRPSLKRQLLVMFLCVIIPVSVLLSLLLAGGMGNLIDRLRLGYVVDMFHFQFWPSYPVFNVADICVVCGAALAAVYYLWLYEKHDRRGGKHGDTDAPSES